MSYALFVADDLIAGPFTTKAECWEEATARGLITLIASFDEDPPRRVLNLRYAIRPVSSAHNPVGVCPISPH